MFDLKNLNEKIKKNEKLFYKEKINLFFKKAFEEEKVFDKDFHIEVTKKIMDDIDYFYKKYDLLMKFILNEVVNGEKCNWLKSLFKESNKSFSTVWITKTQNSKDERTYIFYNFLKKYYPEEINNYVSIIKKYTEEDLLDKNLTKELNKELINKLFNRGILSNPIPETYPKKFLEWKINRSEILPLDINIFDNYKFFILLYDVDNNVENINSLVLNEYQDTEIHKDIFVKKNDLLSKFFQKIIDKKNINSEDFNNIFLFIKNNILLNPKIIKEQYNNQIPYFGNKGVTVEDKEKYFVKERMFLIEELINKYNDEIIFYLESKSIKELDMLDMFIKDIAYYLKKDVCKNVNINKDIRLEINIKEMYNKIGLIFQDEKILFTDNKFSEEKIKKYKEICLNSYIAWFNNLSDNVKLNLYQDFLDIKINSRAFTKELKDYSEFVNYIINTYYEYNGNLNNLKHEYPLNKALKEKYLTILTEQSENLNKEKKGKLKI